MFFLGGGWSFLEKIDQVKKRPKSSQSSGSIFLVRLPNHSKSTHYSDIIMGAMASQITSLMIVYLTVHSGADQRKYQSSASLAFVLGIHQWLVNSLHKWPVTQKMFPFDEVIMLSHSPSLTHLPLEKMSASPQTIFSDSFLWMKSFLFWLKFHWSLFLSVQLTITQYWFR